MFGEVVMQVQEQTNELVHEIGASIVGHEEYQDDWASLAIVGDFKDGGRSQYGYVFMPDRDWEARLPGGFKTLKLLKRLNDEMADATGKRWHRCLVQIKRSDMKIDIQFEYDDPDRWAVSPASVEKDALALRPE